jgi:uncharacterized membrane protein YkoI
MKTLSKVLTATLITTVIAGASLAIASKDKSNQEITSQLPVTSQFTIAQISELALKAQPGVIEEISLERENNKVVFEVEMQTANGDIEIVLDADTGAVLSIEEDDRNHGNDHKKDDLS